jgi:hypothetical protein
MSRARFDEIMRLARMCLEVDASPNDTALGERYSAELNVLDSRDVRLILFAVKLLTGKKYAVYTDNSQTVQDYRSVAGELGAVCEMCEEQDGRTQMIFAPAPRS